MRKQVAFHYGNIPQLVRSEVERLFSSGKLKYLICTSTLVEGVNLSCRNIFLRNPKRGKGNLMSREDFWNLAGRAGRWGKEFQGNIFALIQPKQMTGSTAVLRVRKQNKLSKLRRIAFQQNLRTLKSTLQRDLNQLSETRTASSNSYFPIWFSTSSTLGFSRFSQFS